MNSIFKKLGLTHQNPVLILNAPEEYREIMGSMEAEVHEQVIGKYKFIQIFAMEFADAKTYGCKAISALENDGHLWLCYPKGSSNKYKSDINRSKSWDIYGPYGFEPVSQVAIDENWSAIRYRHVDNIKTMKRKTAATEKGQERIKSI